MSGGTFEYQQYQITNIADAIESIIEKNGKTDEWGYTQDYSQETINEFKAGVEKLKEAAVYAQRIDWLIAGDDAEDTFHKRLKEDLENLQL